MFILFFLLFIDTFHNWNVYWNWFCNHLYLKSTFVAFHLSYWMYCFSEFVTVHYEMSFSVKHACDTDLLLNLKTLKSWVHMSCRSLSHCLCFPPSLPGGSSCRSFCRMLESSMSEGSRAWQHTHPFNRVLAGMFPLQRYWSFLILDGLGTHWRLCQGWNFPKMFV